MRAKARSAAKDGQNVSAAATSGSPAFAAAGDTEEHSGVAVARYSIGCLSRRSIRRRVSVSAEPPIKAVQEAPPRRRPHSYGEAARLQRVAFRTGVRLLTATDRSW